MSTDNYTNNNYRHYNAQLNIASYYDTHFMIETLLGITYPFKKLQCMPNLLLLLLTFCTHTCSCKLHFFQNFNSIDKPNWITHFVILTTK